MYMCGALEFIRDGNGGDEKRVIERDSSLILAIFFFFLYLSPFAFADSLRDACTIKGTQGEKYIYRETKKNKKSSCIVVEEKVETLACEIFNRRWIGILWLLFFLSLLYFFFFAKFGLSSFLIFIFFARNLTELIGRKIKKE